MASSILKLSLILSLLFVSNDLAQGTMQCNLKEFITCSRLISEIELEGACRSVASAVTCLDNVITACGMHKNKSAPLCDEEDVSPYCDMLSGMSQAPMSSYSSHHSICSVYRKMKNCHDVNCGPSGKKFIDQNRPGVSSRPDQCSVEATNKCIMSVAGTTEISKQTCIEVAKAKNCYLDALSYCGGSAEQLHATDTITAGLVYHIAQCKAKEFGFSEDESICVPNPEDTIIYDHINNMKSLEGTSEPNKEMCKLVYNENQKFKEYQMTCNTTDYNHAHIQEVMASLITPLLGCEKKGFKYEGSGAVSGGKCSIQVIVCVAAIFTLVKSLLTHCPFK